MPEPTPMYQSPRLNVTDRRKYESALRKTERDIRLQEERVAKLEYERLAQEDALRKLHDGANGLRTLLGILEPGTRETHGCPYCGKALASRKALHMHLRMLEYVDAHPAYVRSEVADGWTGTITAAGTGTYSVS
jgi:hypothetical protein